MSYKKNNKYKMYFAFEYMINFFNAKSLVGRNSKKRQLFKL